MLRVAASYLTMPSGDDELLPIFIATNGMTDAYAISRGVGSGIHDLSEGMCS